MTDDDARFRFRLRLFGRAKEPGSARAACRMLNVHRSSYDRWQRRLVRFGPEILRPQERRRPRMPNALSPDLGAEGSGAGPGPPRLGTAAAAVRAGPREVGWAARLQQRRLAVLRRHGLSTRAKRLGRVAGYAVARDPAERPTPQAHHIEDNHRGHRAQFDNFYAGRFGGSQGIAWTYIAVGADR